MLRRRILASSLIAHLLLAISVRAASIRVLSVKGDAEVLKSVGGEGAAVAAGDELSRLDRVVTGMDSEVEVAFADDSVVIVRELTDVKVEIDGRGMPVPTGDFIVGVASDDPTPRSVIQDVEIGLNGVSESGASIHTVVDDDVEAIFTADFPPPVPSAGVPTPP